MNGDLSQRKLFQTRKFILTETGLRASYKSPLKTFEYELKYEEIGTKIVDFTSGLKGWLIPTGATIFISVVLYLDRIDGGDVEKGAEFFYLSLAAAFLMLYIFTFKRVRYLARTNNVNAIEFFRNKATINEVDNFIAQILSRRKTFLLERYGQLNRNLSYEPQLNNLKWLLENDVIDQEKYNLKVAELDEMFPSTTVVKGFVVNGSGDI